jgi:mono/diheme cytochrome c family protein
MRRFLIITCTLGLAILGLAIWFKTASNRYDTDDATVSAGQRLFAMHCLSCHGIQQDGIGPPLGGVTLTRTEDELLDFIHHPEKLIASGDERVLALLARYKQPMPAFPWMKDDSIHSILSYLQRETSANNLKPGELKSMEASLPALSGRLAPSIKKSGIKIALQEIIQIPRLPYSTPDLGIVTLRAHPSRDGRLFVSDQGGIIYEVTGAKYRIFLDMREQIEKFSIGPGIATGLGSFDFHPDYLNNGLIYITHAEKYHGQTADYKVSDSLMAEVQWVLSEWKMDDVNSPVFKGTRRELLRLHAPTFGHGAQDLAFIPDVPNQDRNYGLLYWGFGDGGSNNIHRPELGHRRTSFLGSILRIDPRGNNSKNGKYGIPSDNPFAADTDRATVKEIYAYGFRNPHRMAWDPANANRMMVTDIGESNIEEINIVENGGDYGWPVREGSFGISTKKDLKSVYPLQPADADFYKRPFVQYDHTDGFAISGGYVYDGYIEALKNKYVFGDIVNGRLFYVNISPQLRDSTIYELPIWKDRNETNLREMSGVKRLHLRIGYDRFGKQLYVITKADGRIYRVVGD